MARNTHRKPRANGAGAARHRSPASGLHAALSASLAQLDRRAAFDHLNTIENALIDLSSTTETFREMADASEIGTVADTMLRHLEGDLAAVRAAFYAAFQGILGRGKVTSFQ